MILFSAIELINKALGLLVTALLARILSQNDYGIYLSGLVIFGYAMEFSLFASQNRHNADYSKSRQYLQTAAYRARRGLTALTAGLGCLGLLALTTDIRTTFSIWPLLFILLLAPFTFDYVAYGEQRSQIIVLARFLSQLLALLWVIALLQGWLPQHLVYWGNFFQSTLMLLVVTTFLLRAKLLPARALLAGVARPLATPSQLLTAVRDQSQALSLRMLALALVSGELILLGLLQSSLRGDFATAIRVIQALYPFVVFYVDSRVSNISVDRFERYYLQAVFGLGLLMVLLSPWLVHVLFGEKYGDLVFTVALFMPAFLLQAIAQYFMLLSLKAGTEKHLIALLSGLNLLGLVLCVLVVQFGHNIHYVAAILSVKAAGLFLLLPGLRVAIRCRAILLLAGLVAVTVLLQYWGYYQHAFAVQASLLEFLLWY